MTVKPRITVLAVGRAKAGPLRETYQHYAGRLTWPLTLKEVEERRRLPAKQLMEREAELLLAALPRQASCIALDSRGAQLSSEAFAKLIATSCENGQSNIAFLIGGAEGLTKPLLARADKVLSLGAMTWPHLLVRTLLAEQLYRAQTILSGHPYHRS